MEAIRKLSEIVKFVGLILSLFGMYYLINYTYQHHIPFPIEISSLPILLLTVGVVAVFGSLIVILYMLSFGVIIYDPFEIGYNKLIYSGGKYSTIKSYTIIFVAPFVVAVFLFISYRLEYAYYYFVVTLPWYLIYLSLNKSGHFTNDRRKWKVFSSVNFYFALFSLVISNLLFIMSSILVLEAALKVFVVTEIWTLILIMIGFVFFGYMNVIPFNKNLPKFKDCGGYVLRGYEKKESSVNFGGISEMQLMIVFILMFASITPGPAEKLAAASLRLLYRGDVEEYFWVDASEVKFIPSSLMSSEKVGNKVLTKKLRVIMDIGNTIYLMPPNDSKFNENTYSVERKYLHDVTLPDSKINEVGDK